METLDMDMDMVDFDMPIEPPLAEDLVVSTPRGAGGRQPRGSWVDPTSRVVDGGVQDSHMAGTSADSGKKATSAQDEDDEIVSIHSISFWAHSFLNDILFFALCVASCGVLPLLCHWSARLYARLRFKRVPGVDRRADHALVTSLDGHRTIVPIMSTDPLNPSRGWVPSSISRKHSAKMGSDPSWLPRSFVWRNERFWNDADPEPVLEPASPQARWRSGRWCRRQFNLETTFSELHAIGAKCALDAVMDTDHSTKRMSSRERRRFTYGPNILFVLVPPFFTILLLELFKPFCIFQAFSIAAWFHQNYSIYAGVVLVLTLLSTTFNAVETYRNLHAVKKLAETECTVTKLTATKESGEIRLAAVEVKSSELVPGDLIQVHTDMVIPCDCVLISGQCVINEAMLTGESAPVLKAALPLDMGSDPGHRFKQDSDRDAKYKLLSGTRVVQTKAMARPPFSIPEANVANGERPHSIWNFVPAEDLNPNGAPRRRKGPAVPVTAMVVRSAFSTAKGQLIRAILFPKPSKFDFEKKLYYFIINLLIYVIIAILITIYFQAGNMPTWKILGNCVNLITVAIPPALPLALSIGLSVSFTRLQRKRVFCISPPRIINAGRVNTLCFDKTGTLTEDGLSLRGVCGVECPPLGENSMGQNNEESGPGREGIRHLTFASLENNIRGLYRASSEEVIQTVASVEERHVSNTRLALSHILAACHGISVLEEGDSKRVPQSPRKGPGADIQLGKEKRGWLRSLSGWKTKQDEEGADVSIVGLEDAGSPHLRQIGVPFPQTPSASHLQEDVPCFVGDPLEVQMFVETGWRYITRPDNHNVDTPRTPSARSSNVADPVNAHVDRDADSLWANPAVPSVVETAILPPRGLSGPAHPALAIVRRFDFDSELRLMSSAVLHVLLGEALRGGGVVGASLLVKGAPESVKGLCLPSTLPDDFEEVLQALAMNGDRLLACAYRSLDASNIQNVQRASRAEMERELTFCGFMVMENKLKGETPAELAKLTRAGLRSVMVTGDNPLTAVAVARKCGPFFILPSRATFLVDFSPSDAGIASTTGCILRDIATQRMLNFDEHFGNSEIGDVESGGPTPKGDMDLVVTGRAFFALQVQHEMLMRHRKQVGHMDTAPSPRVVPLEHHASNASNGPTPLEAVLTRAGIFARMSPQNKLELMTALMELGYVVCMTGDGANDSGALKAADVGISIASKPYEDDDSVSAAPSIAAPFSTKMAHIGAVATVLAEGRCALVNATTMFKYMFFYGMIQTTSILLIYPQKLELQQWQYLWSDLALVFPMVCLMPSSSPRRELTTGRPESNLLAQSVLISVYGQSIIIIAMQFIANRYLQSQPWYTQPRPTEAGFDAFFNYNTTTSFLFASFQYISMAFALSQSFGRFRAPMATNIPLCFMIFAQFAVMALFFLASPPRALRDAFALKNLQDFPRFKTGLLVLAVLNAVLFILFERLVVLHRSTEPDPIDPRKVFASTRPAADEERPQDGRKSINFPQGARHAVEKLWTDGGHCIPSRSGIPRYTIIQRQTAPVWATLSNG